MSKLTTGTVILGYMAGVAAAALTFVAATTLRDAVVRGQDPLRSDLLVIKAVVVVIYGVVTAFTALLPCISAEKLAALLQVRNVWYFALWGAATGLALGPCVLALNRGLATDSPPPLPDLWVDRYALTLPDVGPMFALSGFVGGLTYWWISSKCPAIRTERKSP